MPLVNKTVSLILCDRPVDPFYNNVIAAKTSVDINRGIEGLAFICEFRSLKLVSSTL